MKRYLCVIGYLSLLTFVYAQQTEVFSSDIYTVRVIANDNAFLPAVVNIQENKFVNISFDKLSHEYNQYQYTISHHNADWSPSGLLEMDFMDGFNNNPIDDYATSLNTTVPYTHYSLNIPNELVQLKVSGNYKVTITDATTGKPVIYTYFRVIEPHVSVAAQASSNTDIARNDSYQQVSFKINTNGYNIRNPHNEVTVQVMQNMRTDNMVTNISPSFVGTNELRYEHLQPLIFLAGNEYRRFEIVGTKHAGQRVRQLLYKEPYYYAELYPDEARNKNYIYDKDHNGRYVIRNENAVDNSIEADYFWVDFSYPSALPLANGKLYLDGEFTYNTFTPSYEMIYDYETQQYRSLQLMKQGAYNYQYLFVPDKSNKGITTPIEGNFYQTENEYLILVYHRPFGERYDKLIGMSLIKCKG